MTGNETAAKIVDRLRNLSPEQRQLLERALANSKTAKTQPIARREPGSPNPLSFGQMRMWFLNRLQPDLPTYNKSSAAKLKGPLDRHALEQAYGELIRRHQILRTTYQQHPTGPGQTVQDDCRFELPVQDLSHHSPLDRERESRRLIEEEACQPFDLRKDRSLRALLIKHSPGEHVLVTTLHHIAMDAWSRNLVGKELSVLYGAFLKGEPSPLSELPIQFADFAAWQHERLSGPAMARQLDYWKQRLADMPAVLELPADRPRPPAPSGRGGQVRFEIPESLKNQLAQLARDERVTLYMVVLASFKTLLSRYTGQQDIAVGSPMAGRPRVETESLVGYLANTVVMRSDFSGNPRFRDLLKQVRDVVTGGFENQAFPFERLVELLAPERRLNVQPLVQVMFNLKNIPTHRLDLAGIQCETIPVEIAPAKVDLWFELVEMPHGIRGKIEYNSDLFEASTIERMIGHYLTLLHGIVADPNQRISEIRMLPEWERRQLLEEWHATPWQLPAEVAVHELFEQQVERTPHAVAIECAGQRVTYRELNGRANRLAHHLRKLGVGPDVMVAMCLERSVELIVGIFGILKAGGAYLPLDITHPSERVAFMLEDSAAPILVTQSSLLPRLPHQGQQVVCLDTDFADSDEVSLENPKCRAEPQHLAYVLFTSGSTGKPKGVMIEHHSVVSFVQWAGQLLSQDDIAGVLASTSITFDISVLEIFVPLSNGGMVIMAWDALALPDLPAANEVTWVNTVPSAMTELVSSGSVPSSVKTITLGGELVPQQVVRETYLKTNASRVFDFYGPTEATVYATYALRTADGVQTIGRPIANNQIFILDANLQPVPIGIPGELHIGGHGLARGYLNRPELTAERFVASPFGEPGSRLYKTGDLARFLPDSNIECLGRLDHQVKVRGFRIELGEIESVLREHPKVHEIVVVAREDVPGDKRLVAYVVPSVIGELSVEELREAAGRLPTYMIPSAFVLLDQLPLNTNGKIDRKALPVPNVRSVEAEVVAPRDTLELQLTTIWEELLNVRPIGVHDDFFELGGHSLLAMRLFDQIAKVTGRDLPLTALFECATVAHLASVLREQDASPRWQSLTPIQPNGSKTPIFLVPPAAGSVLRFKSLADALGPDQPVYGLQPLGHTEQQTPHDRIGDMVSLYVSEIEELFPAGPYLLAGVCFGGSIAFEVAQELRRRGKSVPLLILLDSSSPAHGPGWVFLPPNGVMQPGMAERWASPELAGAFRKYVEKRVDHLQKLGVTVDALMHRMLVAHLKAQLTHRAKEYGGPALLIQSGEFSRNKPHVRKLWSKVLIGGMTTVELPERKHRELLLGTSAIPELARILNESLGRISL